MATVPAPREESAQSDNIVNLTHYDKLVDKPLNRGLQDIARVVLASTFAFSFIFTLIASFIGSLTSGGNWPVKDWLQVMLPAQTGLFGSALGFYFGSNGSSRSRSED